VFLLYLLLKLIRDSTVAIEDYLNGDMVSIAEVKEELLLNIGLIIGAALASGILLL